VLCGKDADGETIRVDLLLWTDPAFKIVVEMKAPLRSDEGSNSAMTQMRMRFYRDLDRMRHLVDTKWQGIQRGMFLAVVNEPGYVVFGRQRKNEGYATYDGTRLDAGAVIPSAPGRNGCPYDLRMPGHLIEWRWLCEREGGRVRRRRDMKHFWLEPIAVYPPGVTKGHVSVSG